MSTTPEPQTGSLVVGDPEQRRRTLAASVSGTVIEWYDFTLYGLAAALVFGPLYFPDAGALGGVLASLATFAVGLGARPIGGLIFAHYGDRIGRKPTMFLVLMVMGVSTTLIGLLPTAETIGIWAAVILVVLRLLQGAGAGAEFAGAITMVTEVTGNRGRAYAASLPGAAIYVGTGGATLVFTLVTLMPEEAFLAWGWRIPFLASAAMVLVAAYLRWRVEETPAFRKLEQNDSVQSAPVLEVLRNNRRSVLLGMGVFVLIIPWAYAMQVFVLSYVTNTLEVPKGTALTGLIIAEFLAIPVILACGRLADRVGRRPVMLFGAAFCLLFAMPMFWMLDSGSGVLIAVAMTLGICVSQGCTSGPAGAMLADLFPARSRWSGIALSREIPAAVVGGTAPLVATALVAWGGGSPVGVAVYLMVLSLVGLVAIVALPETLERTTRPAPTAAADASVPSRRS
ncbi:MFS transporter [Pseudonocardia sp. McavD-2-B]|uniref:MFS transporter n=1 Tax=Pseudonocardia sp. McavD-2-B TaxID=2954499 RepID=UPI002097AC9B|nr:MFS transporter [Pseudonocardia sp. McavD-2-B]MCO7192539.1 MHS family MFS transporter [Pseudonocardia sp. McavD-2-B]